MSRLFELFVAKWFEAHLQPPYFAEAKEVIDFASGHAGFETDLIIYQEEMGIPLVIVDTKYKAPKSPSKADIAQVVAYATAKKCQNAVLLYPTELENELDAQIGDVRVRSMAFDLDAELEDSGHRMLTSLLS